MWFFSDAIDEVLYPGERVLLSARGVVETGSDYPRWITGRVVLTERRLLFFQRGGGLIGLLVGWRGRPDDDIQVRLEDLVKVEAVGALWEKQLHLGTREGNRFLVRFIHTTLLSGTGTPDPAAVSRWAEAIELARAKRHEDD